MAHDSDMTPAERAAAQQQQRNEELAAAVGASARTRFRWSETAQRYIDEQGRFVSDKTVAAAIDEALTRSAVSVKAATEQLRAGEISLAQWQQIMEREIKNVHITQGALAKGGFKQLTDDDLSAIERRIREQLGFLQRRAEAIADGTQALDGTLTQRAQMYTRAGRQTYFALHQVEMQRIGYNQYRNVLGIAEHCSECLELAGRGWVPNGSIAAPGERMCIHNCKCTLQYRRTTETDPSHFPTIKGTPQADKRAILRPAIRR